MMYLYKSSDRADIAVFLVQQQATHSAVEPAQDNALVWAVDEEHLAAYLFPEDCPRIYVSIDKDSRLEDIEAFQMSPGRARLYYDEAWRDRLEETTLYLYKVNADTFIKSAQLAGLYSSDQNVAALDCKTINNIPATLTAMGFEVKATDNLTALQHRLVKTTLNCQYIAPLGNVKIAQLRQSFNRLDEQLVDLIIARYRLADEMARLKQQQQRGVEDLAREAEIIDRLTANAPRRYHDLLTEVYQLLFEHSKHIQYNKLAAKDSENPIK